VGRRAPPRDGALAHGRVGAGPGRPGEKWAAIQGALRAGFRGLPGGDTLPGLLARHGRKAPWQRR
jgi:hypothetical protein